MSTEPPTNAPGEQKLRCKPGDLVLLLPGERMNPEHVGRIAVVLERASTGSIDLGHVVLDPMEKPRWMIRCAGLTSPGAWADDCLKVLRGPGASSEDTAEVGNTIDQSEAIPAEPAQPAELRRSSPRRAPRPKISRPG